MSNTRSAPNRSILPPKVSVVTGIHSNIKQLPPELLRRKGQKQVLPFLSSPGVLSKAEKWATQWYNRTKELEENDAYHERIRTQLNLPERNLPLNANEVREMNLDEITAKITRGVNDNITPVAMPNPQLPPTRPPSNRGGKKASSQTDNVAEINPLTRENTTTSTQTMREMADASTSAKPTVATGSTQTDKEPRTGGDLALMSLDPPLQQIVPNYHYQNMQTVNNYLQQHRNDFNYHTVMQDNRSVQNVLNMQNWQQNLLQQHVDNRSVNQNLLQQDPSQLTLPAPPVTHPNQLLIEAPQNTGIVRPNRRCALLDRSNFSLILK